MQQQQVSSARPATSVPATPRVQRTAASASTPSSRNRSNASPRSVTLQVPPQSPRSDHGGSPHRHGRRGLQEGDALGASKGPQSSADSHHSPRCPPPLDLQQYTVEHTHINISDLQRVDDGIVIAHKKHVTHSAGIKRCYTPLWEIYKRSLILPPEMSDEEKDLIRRLRQDPFSKRRAGGGTVKLSQLDQKAIGPQWRVCPVVRREKVEDVEMPRNSACTPRALKTSHRHISVVPVGKMVNDISFRPIRVQSPHRGDEDSDSWGARAQPRSRNGARSAQMTPNGRISSSNNNQPQQQQSPFHFGAFLADSHNNPPSRGVSHSEAPSAFSSSPRADASVGMSAPTPPPFTPHHRPNVRGLGGGVEVGARHLSAAVLQHSERSRMVVSLNELKNKGMLIDLISPVTDMLTPEMFVRIEDDFLRATNGRKSRILLPEDVGRDIKLGGNVFTKRRLTFLMTRDATGGDGVSFVQLFHYAFPYVSSALIDSYMLRYSTSMNVHLGGPLQLRADEATFQAIRRFYLKFDSDGDGVVTVHDIQRQQRKLHGAMSEEDIAAASDEEKSHRIKGAANNNAEEFEDVARHVAYNEKTGEITLEDFSIFARFLFPPYKVLPRES